MANPELFSSLYNISPDMVKILDGREFIFHAVSMKAWHFVVMAMAETLGRRVWFAVKMWTSEFSTERNYTGFALIRYYTLCTKIGKILGGGRLQVNGCLLGTLQ